VDINTGALMKQFRSVQHSTRAETVAAMAAKRFRTVERMLRLAVAASGATAGAFGHRAVAAMTSAARALASKDIVPAWLPNTPAAAAGKLPETRRQDAAAVYFTACINRVFGRRHGQNGRPSLQEAMIAVSARAGMPLWIPEDIGGNCCATIWHSKGYRKGNAIMANRMAESLWRWSEGGRLPVVCDASSCSFGLISQIVEHLTAENRDHHAQLSILDSISWAHDRLLPRLKISRKVPSAVLHPSCSVRHLKLAPKLQSLASAMAEEAITPVSAECCGFAGDRGFLHPELTRSATADEAKDVRARRFDVYLGSNRTCEIGLNLATGEDYVSFVYLLEELTRPTRAGRLGEEDAMSVADRQ
jgi:D-lactate dehydrogenase